MRSDDCFVLYWFSLICVRFVYFGGVCVMPFRGVGGYFGVGWFWLRFVLLFDFDLGVLACCFGYCVVWVDLLAWILCFGLLVDCWWRVAFVCG